MSQELIEEINRLKDGLLYIARGQNLEYINSYGRAQPDFPLDRFGMKQKAYEILNNCPMTPARAESMALSLCMKGLGRYLECLNGVANVYEHLLSPKFVEDVRKDFTSYATKMSEAGFEYKVFNTLESLNVQE